MQTLSAAAITSFPAGKAFARAQHSQDCTVTSALETKFDPLLHLTSAEREALDALERRELTLVRGEQVFRSGAHEPRLFIIGQGCLHASMQTHSGGRQIVRFLFSGDITSGLSLSERKSSSTLTAVTRCTLLETSRCALGNLFARHPRLAAAFYAMLADEVATMGNHLTLLGHGSALERVAHTFAVFSSRANFACGQVIIIPLNQQDVGDYCGLTKAHVNRVLKRMEASKWIAREGREIRVLDADALQSLTAHRTRRPTLTADWQIRHLSNSTSQSGGGRRT